MNYAYLPTALTWITAFYLMYYFHEGGHYFAAKSLNIQVTKVYFKKVFLIPIPHAVETDGEIESNTRSVLMGKSIYLFMSGPTAGIVPIVLVQLFYPDAVNLGIFLLVYLYGCTKDVVESCKLLIYGKLDGIEITE